MTIAIRIDGMRHLLVGGCIVEESADFGDDSIVIGAHEVNGAAGEGLRTFGGVAHHENGFAKAWRLLLNATRVGKDDAGFAHEVHKLKIGRAHV